MDTPTLDKLRAARVRGQSQAIGEFLDWLQGKKGLVIATYVGEELPELAPAGVTIEGLLAEYFGIDLDRAERERAWVLEAARKVQEEKT